MLRYGMMLVPRGTSIASLSGNTHRSSLPDRCIPAFLQCLNVQRSSAVSVTRGATLSDTSDTLSKVTLLRASELTGRSRSTIHRAMEKGRLSFEKDETGNRVIDVSELDRVFGLRPQHEADPVDTDELHRHDVQLIELRAQLEIERSKRALFEERVD